MRLPDCRLIDHVVLKTSMYETNFIDDGYL